MTNTIASLSDKILIVYLRDSGPETELGIALVGPTLQTFWGECFLTGRVPPHERDWSSDLMTAVRWIDVAHFIIFSSLEEYQHHLNEAPPR